MVGISLLPVLLLLSGCLDCSSPAETSYQDDTPAKQMGQECTGCNVILLNIGSLRADQVGLVDPSSELTPNIDAFFGDGIILEQAMAPSGATYFSATSIATATEAMFNQHDVRQELALKMAKFPPHGDTEYAPGGGRWFVLSMLLREGLLLVDRVPTIAETFQAGGYQTSAVNDWIHTGRMVALDRGFQQYIELTDTSRRDPKAPTSTVSIEDQVALVVEQLGEPSESPLYLYFHPNSLHFPFPHPDDPKQLVFLQDDPDLFRRAYSQRVKDVDEALQVIFERLESGGWLENSIIALYSNHGVALGENGHMGVGTSYQGCVRVPLLIRHPHVQQQHRIGTPVSLVDLGPTLYELVGIPDVAQTSASSMVPLLSGTGEYPRVTIFGLDLQQEYARRGDWKLVRSQEGKKELFDLRRDPTEQLDRLSENQAVLDELQMALELERAHQRRLEERLSSRYPETD